MHGTRATDVTLALAQISQREDTHDLYGEPYVNHLPTATDEALTTTEDTPVEWNVLANDTDPDNDNLFIDEWDVTPAGGTVTQVSTGVFRVTPDHDFYGTIQFTYKINDGIDTSAMPATVTVNVTPVNDPVAAFNDAYAWGFPYLPWPTPVHVGVYDGLLANDIDYDRIDDLEVVLESVDTSGVLGTVEVYDDGSFDFAPADFGMSSFSYQCTDGVFVSGTVHVYLFVNPMYPAPGGPPPTGLPEAIDDWYALGEEELAVSGEEGVLVNDINASIAILNSHPAEGRLTHFDDDGSFNYSPELVVNDQFFGYRVVDVYGRSAPGGVSLYALRMQIYNGQNAPNPVDDKVRQSVGAFTVTNWNDTDGDAIADTDDGYVGFDFFNPGLTPGTFEVDLMKLVINKPNDPSPMPGTVRLSVSDNVRLWETPYKITEILVFAGEASIGFADDQPRTVWVEAVDPSADLQDITLRMLYEGAKYTVNATSIWATMTNFTNLPDDPNIIAQPAADATSATYKDLFRIRNTAFGAKNINPRIENVNEMQFTVGPDKIWLQRSIRFDISRNVEEALGAKQGNASAFQIVRWFPYFLDVPTDDDHTDDEADIPSATGHIYVSDAPGWTINDVATFGFDRMAMRENFHEFVRVYVNGERFQNKNNNLFNNRPPDPHNDPPLRWLEGSRSSYRVPWHSRIDIIKDPTNPAKYKRNTAAAGENEIMMGHKPLGDPPF